MALFAWWARVDVRLSYQVAEALTNAIVVFLLMADAFLTQLNSLDENDFVNTLGGVFEHSPWVARGAYGARPFATLEALHAAMVQTVEGAGTERQLTLIRAHPDLAGKAALAGELTEHSRREQAGAGLGALSPADFERFHHLNEAYKAKFGFPFILAVKGHNASSILTSFETRLSNSEVAERDRALNEIAKIARFRLEALSG